jgi:1-acyl-sn-glycerol-3-phosphate acyltransferase
MIYKFFELLLNIGIRIYFKNKHVTGKNNIPKGKPVMFVANHPGAFMDPIVIGTLGDRSLYYIARGESFKNKFAAWFFRRLHMIPVYRKEETPELTHKNAEIFSACYTHFEKGRSLMIFPEGTSKIEYRLRKVKSGAARIALGAEAKNNFGLDLTIVPVGLTYSNPKNFRTDVHVSFGKPILIKEYQEDYWEDSFSTARRLTKNIEVSIKNQMLVIENKENDLLFNQLQSIYFEEMIKRFKDPDLTNEEKLKLKNDLVQAIDYYKNSKPEFIKKLQQLLNKYFHEIQEIELKHPEFNKRLVGGKTSFTKHILSLIVGFSLFIVGFLTSIVPYKMSGYMAEKFSRREDFTGGLRLVIGCFTFLFTYVGWGFFLGYFMSISAAVGVVILLPILGMFALGYVRVFEALKAEVFYQKMIVTENYNFKNLLELRQSIIEELEEARISYNKTVLNIF